MTEIRQESMMTPSERLACERIAKSEEIPHSQRASALLAIDAGKSQEDAAKLSGLTPNQVKHWLGRFGTRRLEVFPDAVLRAAAQPAVEEELGAVATDVPDQAGSEGEEEAEASPVAGKEAEASALDTFDQTEEEYVDNADETSASDIPASADTESVEQAEVKAEGPAEAEPKATEESEDQDNQRSETMSESHVTKVESYPVSEGKSYGYQAPGGAESSEASSVAAKKEQLFDAFKEFIDSLASSYEPPPSGGGTDAAAPGGEPMTGEQPGGEGAPSTGESPTGQAPAGEVEAAEAYKASLTAQRESFVLDRARESARAAESVSPRPTVTASWAPGGKHESVSSTAPLQDSQEFAPFSGSKDRGRSETMEVVAAPSGEAARSETAPASPVIGAEPLDAYWGSFGTAVERAAERVKMAPVLHGESQQVHLEMIIGPDDRVLVTATEAYPWRCICSLIITAQTGTVYVGTGWLVGPRLVVTAGHCVYLHDEGGWASRIEVIPGRNGTERRNGSATSSALRSSRGWTIDRDRDYDYGAILLPEDRRFGDQLGWFGFATREDSHFSGITLNLSGYPGDGGKAGPERQQGTQWFNSRGVKDVFERQITYEIDTYGGQSGAPVWEMTADGSRYGLAIHTWGTSASNGATRITRGVLDNLLNWNSEVP